MWYPIPNYEGLYEINKNGQVRAVKRKVILAQTYNNRGYLKVGLSKDGKRTTKGVHRLLMETFNPIDNMEDMTVNHINHIKDDNRLENLEWLSKADNVKEAYQAGLHENKHLGGNNKRAVQCIETGEVFESMAAAARAVNLASSGKIGDAIRDKSLCKGRHWRWYNESEQIKSQKVLEDFTPLHYSKLGGQIKITYEDGSFEIFPNITLAAEGAHTSKKTLHKILKGESTRAKYKAEIIPYVLE